MMTGTHGQSRHGEQVDQATEDTAVRTHNLKREADLRQQAVQRMRYMSIQHAMHAWEHRYSDPIAPYGLAFLYAQPAPQEGWLSLTAATELWLAGPEAGDLPRLLFDLNNAVAQELSKPDFDLRRDLANRVDEKMAEDAWYVGLGVSSLDTYSGTWEQACANVDRYVDVPAQIRLTMTDTTIILCDRRGLSDFNTLTVHSTQALSMSLVDTPYPWSAASAQDLHTDPAHTSVLRWMEELNLNLWRADNARLVAARQHEQGPGFRRRQP
jgi:hypothetical protein